MLNEQALARLNTLTDEFEDLTRPLQISDFNAPINRDEEKSKLFASFAKQDEYNPQFQYKEAPADWERPLTKFLHEIDPFDSGWEAHLYQEVRRFILELEATRAHDPNEITAETVYSYGIPTIELVNEAQKILQNTKPENENREIAASVAADILSTALVQAGLPDWRVELKNPMNARMMVRSVEKKVFVREDALFSRDSVKRLLVHEIGTHVFRYINGERQQLQILKLGLIGYLGTEEGLATYHEKRFGVQDIAALRTYALRVIAAHMSLTSSFYEIFDHLASHISNLDELFDIVTRAKRGFRDTKCVGGHVKDQVYLRGFLDVSEHLSNYPQDHAILMCGKVSLSMLGELKELDRYQMLTLPQFLPDSLV